MSRGRKQNTLIYSSEWDKIFQKSQGYYFQYIISKLGENPNKLLTNDNSSDILIQIKKEKEKLIKEKKIKQGKLQEAELQSELFDIPKNWIWCKLDDLCSIITDGTHQTPSYKENGRPFISAQHVKPFIFSPEKYKYVSEEAYQECIKSGKPEKDDILVTRVGAIGEATVIDVDMEFAYYVSVGLIKTFKEYVLPKFLAYAINSPYGNLYSKGNVSSKGSSAGNFNLGRIRSFFIPLAPISEQKKILNFLEDLGRNSLSDSEIYFDKEIENEIISIHKAQLLNTQTTNELNYQLDLIKQLRQAFLREAMQGKLVKSTNTEKTGHQLLEKIKAEKAHLISDKKLKKEKELASISEDEIPFEIPENWAWCRLGEIGICKTGTTPSTIVKEYFGNDIPFIKPADITLKGLIINNEGLTFSGLKQGVLIPSNSLMMVCIGGSIGKSFFSEIEVSCNQQINTLTPLSEIKSIFLQFWLQSNYFQKEIWSKASGGTTPIVNRSKWESIFVPLPPLHEQEQIVAKLEELMAFCDGLEQSIKESQKFNEQLLQQVLREALKGGESLKIMET